MSRLALFICAVLCVSCAGAHGNDEVGTGSDAANREPGDAVAQAQVDASKLDAADVEASILGDAAARALDGRDASQADAAQALRDGGGSVQPGACRTQADCPNGTSCRAPDYADPACRGAPCLSELGPTCTRNDECGPQLRCHVYQDLNCSVAEAFYRSCAAPCSADTDCRGTRCQQDGRCLPAQHCSLTKSCPPHFHCDAMLGNAETGCVRNSCRADTECDRGVCLFELCYERVGVCRAQPVSCTAP